MIGTRGGYAIPSNLGFIQTGDYSEDVSNPVLRTGTLGWISNNSKEFLLDAFSYGGNSGSPVFTKADFINSQTFLIGMVIGHLGEEVEVSQSKDPKNVQINLQGNSGLARCLWSDDILWVYEKVSKLK